MILCDDEDDDDDEEEEDDDGEEDEDDFLATYHPLFWAQPPQLALVIHLLHQDAFLFQNSHSHICYPLGVSGQPEFSHFSPISIHENFLLTLYSQAPISANISDNLSN